MKRSRVAAIGTALALLAGTALVGGTYLHGINAHAAAANPYEVSLGQMQNATPQFQALGANGPSANSAHFKNGRGGTCLADLPVDSIPNFCGTYNVAGFDSQGNPTDTWTYNMVGNAPQKTGIGTTTFNAPIIPVKVEFLNTDGTVAFTSDPTQDVQRVLNSPVFSDHKYTSGPKPTQFADALQRAEFYNQARPDWHTVLAPSVKAERTMQVPAGKWFAVKNADGTCCVAYLVNINTFVNRLFPPTFPVDNSTVIGSAELAGDMTPSDISSTLFHSVYLYDGSNPFAPGACCVLGFHSFDFEPGATPSDNFRAYVMNYSSWIQPGFFRSADVQDVMALSHEMSELYNDPFVQGFNNLDLTPWWLSNGLCQNNLETGDVIEVLPNLVFPITMNGFTYHPQNEAMLPWFESNHTSDAIDHAYSYPDETVLTDSNTSQQPGCTGPA